MRLPLFDICENDSSLVALLSDEEGNLKIFPDRVPQDTISPYVLYNLISGEPENYLNQRPDIDFRSVQIDVYAKTADLRDEIVEALTYAIEPHAHITSWDGEGHEDETKNYRCTFTVDWFVTR
jgi:hypothetical protein